MTHYAQIIAQELTALNRTDVPANVVEELMRTEYSTLDHLSRTDFAREARVCVQVWDEMPNDCRAWYRTYCAR